MRKLLPTALLGISGLVAIGLLALPTTTASSAQDAFAKREEDVPELVLVDDDDDDDTNSRSGTGNSRSRADNTNSVFSRVSRDRDYSRGDRTKDWTRDGQNSRVKRDWSKDKTNDRSRNDTRR